VKVLNFLAAHPGEGSTLSEIARGIVVNVASLHAVLNALESEGYVARDPARKAYRLGFGPIGVGLAALAEHAVVRHARQATIELAERTKLDCIAGVIVGDELLSIAEAGRPERLQMRPRVGHRLPYAPPLGILGAAFETSERLEAWLERMGPRATQAAKRNYRRAATAVRRQGFDIGLETPTRQAIGQLMLEVSGRPQDAALRYRLTRLVAQLGREEHQLLELDPTRIYAVNNIQAPLFDAQRRVIGGITLLGFPPALHAHEIERYTHTLVRTAADITTNTGGRAPPDGDS
jgi:DNA-binding IclR family transcriptional regulator